MKFVEVLRNWLCPREGQSVQSVEAPIQPTGAQGFCSGLFREYTFPFLPASQREELVRS